MKKRCFKRILSIILAIILSAQLAVTPAVPVSAGGVSEFFIDKAVDIGIRAACEGVMALSESAEASGHSGVSKATAFVAQWTLMDAAEVAAVEAVELCEEILAELEELEKTVNANDAVIAEAVSEIQWLQGKTSLSNAKKSDIVDPINPLLGAMGAFESYVQTRIDFSNGKATKEEFDNAQLNFLFVLSRFTDATPDASSFESLGNAVFTTQDVSNKMATAIDSLITYMNVDPTHDYNVMSTAMGYAYYYYPFSHQQYDFVLTQVKYQLSVIMEVLLMYNEFLALQYDYLSAYVDINTEEGKTLYNNYNGWVGYLDSSIGTLSENIVDMFDAEYQVSAKRSLSINDYMKPEDAVKTRLQGSYNNSTFTYDTYKLMTNTDNHKHNIYYLYGDDGTAGQFYDGSTGEQREKFLQLTSELSDGYNTYQLPADAGSFVELFNTNAFVLNGGTVRNSLYDFDSSGNTYSLIGSGVDYLTTSDYKVSESGVIDKEYSAEFQMIDVDKTFTSMELFETEPVADDENDYKAAVFVAKNTYSQNVTAQCTGLEGSDMVISSGSTTIGVGETAAIPSGNTLTIKFKLPEGCRDFSLVCKRAYDTFSSDTTRTASTVLLDENFMDYLEQDNDGYYSLNYHMPYSECVFILDANEFTYDEEGRIEISCYEDLEAVANQIKGNPSLYASKSYIVTADIKIPDNSSLEPIGTDNFPFTGTFDGQGYTISNLKFSTNGKAGLFGVNKGTIKNLDISGAEISGNIAGAAAGYSTGTIENVHVYNSTVNSSRQGGGICGIQNSGKISNCSTDSDTKIIAYCDVNAEHFATGGIVGKLEGTTTVEKCTNEASIEHSAYNSYINTNYAGGIIGAAFGTATVDLCINTGSVIAVTNTENEVVGGICGGGTDSLAISNCANRGNLSAEKTSDENCPSYVGGILGMYYDYGNSATASIDSCYSIAELSVAYGNTGGIVCGAYTTCNVTNCYFDSNIYAGDVKSTEAVINKVVVTESGGKTTDQFKSGEVTYLLNSKVTDGTQVWYQNLDNGQTPDRYPTLGNNGENTVYVIVDNERYSNYQHGDVESVLERAELRTYQRVRDEAGRFATDSVIAYGYSVIDNENKTITVYAMNTAERLGILMHQGPDGASGIMKLTGNYPKLTETSKELLESGEEEPDIYTDGNGCIFINIKGKTNEDIPELMIIYEQKPTENYEPTEYKLTVKIVDVSQFAKLGVYQTRKLDQNDPDYDVILDESVVVPLKDSDKTAGKDSVQTGDHTNVAVPMTGIILSAAVIMLVFKRKRG